MSKSRQKGTGGETEVKRLLDIPGLVRNPPASVVDLSTPEGPELRIPCLATRPDHGEWLITTDLDSFLRLWHNGAEGAGLDVEVKRYKKFSLHSIWREKFRRG